MDYECRDCAYPDVAARAEAAEARVVELEAEIAKLNNRWNRAHALFHEWSHQAVKVWGAIRAGSDEAIVVEFLAGGGFTALAKRLDAIEAEVGPELLATDIATLQAEVKKWREVADGLANVLAAPSPWSGVTSIVPLRDALAAYDAAAKGKSDG